MKRYLRCSVTFGLLLLFTVFSRAGETQRLNAPGHFLTVPPDSIVVLGPRRAYIVPVQRRSGKFPNWQNLISEVTVRGGFAPGSSCSDQLGGLVVGISSLRQLNHEKWLPDRDSAKVRCWVRLTHWKDPSVNGVVWRSTDLRSSLMIAKKPHTGPPSGFDSTGITGDLRRRPLHGEMNILSPRTHNDKLFAEQIALKFNIAASEFGSTMSGLGDLVYHGPGNPADGKSILGIVQMTDTAMTYWQNRPAGYFDSLYSAIFKINRAFACPLDTVQFLTGGKLVLDGAIDLAAVPFLSEGPVSPFRFARTTNPETDGSSLKPVVTQLHQNYPNPFNPSTEISYDLAEGSPVKLSIFNALGQEVKILVEGYEESGVKSVTWDASALPSGMYFYRLIAAGHSDMKKMMLLK